MNTYSSDDDIYIGRSAGKKLKENLENAKKSVKIVSPFLTPSYIEDLLKLVDKGINVTLITSNNVEQGGNYSSFTHTDLIKQKKEINLKEKNIRKKGISYSLICLILPAILFYFDYFRLSLSLLFIISFSFYFFYNKRIYFYSYFSPINLKVVPDEYYDKKGKGHLIHSKIYVIDEKVAYLGSINYTYRAFKFNYEVVMKVKSLKAVKDISKEVDRLLKDDQINSKDINEWGKEIYPEPRH